MKNIIWVVCLASLSHMAIGQNIGIGTNTPAVALHIKKSTDEILRLQGLNPYISLFDNAGSAIGYLQGYGTDVLLGTYFGNPSGAIKFYNNNVVNMTILPNGNVGIGTTNPGSALSFPNVLGKKISFWNSGANSDYGIGIQPGTMQFYTAGQDLLTFGYGNSSAFSETMRFATGTGQLMIGTSSPAGRLHVLKDAEALRLTGSGTYLSFYNGSAYKGYLWSKEPNDIELGTATDNTAGNLNLRVHGTEGMTLQNDGRVRVGAVACVLPAQGSVPKLSVQGPLGFKKDGIDNIGEWAIRYGYPTVDNINGLVFCYNGGLFKAFIDEFDGSWRASSDARLKENFENYKPVLDGIKNLHVLTYQYKSDKTGHKCFGLTAQNLKQYFPELVSGDEKNKDEYMAIAYDKTGVLAIKAIQEQQQVIEEQQRKIEMLEKRLDAMETKQKTR